MNLHKKGMDKMENKKKVLVVLPTEERHRILLEEAYKEGDFRYIKLEDLTEDIVSEANIMIGNIPIDLVKKAKNLQWLQLNNAGTEGYTELGLLPENAILTNATGAYGGIISEHMLGFLLSIQKKLYLYQENKKEGLWKREGYASTIEGSTTLILGFGDIGSSFGWKMKALGSKVIGIRRTNTEKPDYVDELFLMDQLDEVLPKADIIALSLPAYKETYHVINKERLLKMKKDAILINVGRGSAIDTEALCDVIELGHLQGVGLDVTEPEPLPKDHRLWKYPNVLITPHVSGSFQHKTALEKIFEISANNLKRFSAGEKLINEVDFTTGYRKLH